MDTLGPLYFCLVFKELLESLESELVLGYLDDVAVGDTAAIVLKDFIVLEKTAEHLGLEVNRSKCEVVGHTDKTREMFNSQNVTLPESSLSSVVFLGSPMLAGSHLNSMLAAKEEELQRLTKRLELMPSHDSLFLLRNVLAAPRLVHLLRTAPCWDSPELPMYDAVLRNSLSATLNIDVNRWTQASLPVRWGGLGVRGITLLAPSAFLASAASTMELTSALLPMRLRMIEDSGIASAMSTWTRLAKSL